MAQGLERSPRKRKLGCSNPSRDKPKLLRGCPCKYQAGVGTCYTSYFNEYFCMSSP